MVVALSKEIISLLIANKCILYYQQIEKCSIISNNFESQALSTCILQNKCTFFVYNNRNITVHFSKYIY